MMCARFLTSYTAESPKSSSIITFSNFDPIERQVGSVAQERSPEDRVVIYKSALYG